MNNEDTIDFHAEVERRMGCDRTLPSGRALVHVCACCTRLIATAVLLLTFAGCATLQYEGGVNKQQRPRNAINCRRQRRNRRFGSE